MTIGPTGRAKLSAISSSAHLQAAGAKLGRSAAAAGALASLGLGLVAYRALVHDHGQDAGEAAAQVLVAWTFVASGAIATWRRPQSRVGPLLLAAGLALLIRRLQYSHDSALFTIGFALGEVSNAFVAHAVLGYPTGRLRRTPERAFVALGYVLTIALPVAVLLFFDPTSSCFFDCAGKHAHSVIAAFPNAAVPPGIRTAYRVSVFGVLGAVFLVLVTRRLATAGAAGRRFLAPLLLAAILAAIRAVSEAALTFSSYSEPVRTTLFWWQIAVQAAIPLALLVGLLRARLARAAVADALPALERAHPDEIARLVGAALGDPTLEVAFWLPEEQRYVDGGGAPFALPAGDAMRAVTRVESGGPLAVIVHDPVLAEDPDLVQDAAAAARLTLENARLQAELQAQLVAVRESRARIATAGDTERRRVERDLHDGAQQRLLALALELTSAKRRLDDLDRGDLGMLLSAAVEELRATVEELRALAQGLHPAILTEQGLGPALAQLAARFPVPTRAFFAVDGRLSETLEATVYFVVAEGLANVAKHAGASSVAIRVYEDDDAIVTQVQDDGCGGADPGGSGLRGLTDRVEANGGTLEVVSTPGTGTQLTARLPCAS